MVRKTNQNSDLHLEKYTNVTEEVVNREDLELETTEESGYKSEMTLIYSKICNIGKTILEMVGKIKTSKLNNSSRKPIKIIIKERSLIKGIRNLQYRLVSLLDISFFVHI